MKRDNMKLSYQKQIELGKNLFALAHSRIIELESLHNKYTNKMKICHDGWKLQKYREQLVTIERSIEINKELIGANK